jgi:hypothetical protein
MPLTPKTTGFRFDIRLDNLSPADVVELSCPQCNWGAFSLQKVRLARQAQ